MRKLAPSLLIGLIIGILLFNTACGGGSTPSKPAAGTTPTTGTTPAAPATPTPSGPKGKVVIGMSKDSAGIDPHSLAYSGGFDAPFQDSVYDGLYALDLDAKVVPSLATGYTVSPDGLKYTFTLRKDVKFHNGDPFTAADVKFTAERAGKFRPVTGPMLSLDRVEVVDDYTVNIFMKKMEATFILGTVGRIVPAKHIQQVGDEAFGNNPVGTGPFRFVKRSIGEFIELEAMPTHFWRPAKVKSLILKIVPDATTRVNMLKTGEIDMMEQVPPHLLKDVESSTGLRIQPHPTNLDILIHIDTATKQGTPYNDRRVRLALNYAIDRKAIVDKFFNGKAPIAACIPSEGVIGYDPDCKPYPYDPAKAKQLIAEAGYPNGFEGEVFTHPGGTYLVEVTQAATGYWDKIGLKIKPTSNDTQAWIARIMARQSWPLYLATWPISTMDPESTFRLMFRSNAFAFGVHSSPELDKEIDLMGTMLDLKQRDAQGKKVARMIYDDAGFIPFYYEPQFFGMNSKVKFYKNQLMSGFPVALWTIEMN